LLFASQSGTVFSCLAGDKTYRWSFKAGGAIEGDPTVDDTSVYIASNDRSLYKLNKDSGHRVWRARFPSPLKVGPVVAGGLVYQYCQGNGIAALDAGTGNEKWRLPTARTLAAHSAAGDVILTEDSRLMVVEHDTGKEFGAIEAPGVAQAISNTRDGAVYLWGAKGRVMCVRLDDVPYLRRQQVMSAQQDLNQSPDRKRKVEPLPALPKPEPDPLENDPLRSEKDRTP
jgi:outer membrane protein assembly factor BamB